jgi:hypothetical protein
MGTNQIRGIILMSIGLGLAPPSGLQALEVHTLNLARPMVIAGVDLRAAVYDVHWELQGTRATVTFLRKGRAVATVQGECATLNRSAQGDTLYFSKHPDGFLAVRALGFASSNKGIVFPLVRSHARASRESFVAAPIIRESWHLAPPVPRVYR